MTGDLDPVRLPKGRRALRRLFMAAAVVLGGIGALEWWLAEPLWRLPVVIAISAAVGWGAAQAFMRSSRRAAGRRAKR